MQRLVVILCAAGSSLVAGCGQKTERATYDLAKAQARLELAITDLEEWKEREGKFDVTVGDPVEAIQTANDLSAHVEFKRAVVENAKEVVRLIASTPTEMSERQYLEFRLKMFELELQRLKLYIRYCKPDGDDLREAQATIAEIDADIEKAKAELAKLSN